MIVVSSTAWWWYVIAAKVHTMLVYSSSIDLQFGIFSHHSGQSHSFRSFSILFVFDFLLTRSLFSRFLVVHAAEYWLRVWGEKWREHIRSKSELNSHFIMLWQCEKIQTLAFTFIWIYVLIIVATAWRRCRFQHSIHSSALNADTTHFGWFFKSNHFQFYLFCHAMLYFALLFDWLGLAQLDFVSPLRTLITFIAK